MVKEIHLFSENYGGLYFRAITRQSLFIAIEKFYDFYSDNRMPRKDLKRLWQSEIFSLDEYGEEWELNLIELLEFHGVEVDRIDMGDFEGGASVSGILSAELFEAYAKFCRKHNRLGNVILIS